MKDEIKRELKEDFEKDLRLHISDFTKEQDGKNKDLFADKEIEMIVRWIVRITTGSLIAGVFGVVIANIISLIT